MASFIFMMRSSLEHISQKKVVNYSNKGKGDYKVIAAASGTPEDYVPFYTPETFILSDHHHLELYPKLHEDVKTASFSKYAKDNKKNLDIPARLKKTKTSRT